MSASAPTSGPTGCCASTATPPTIAPRRSASTTSRPTWWSRWPATTCGCCSNWVSAPAESGCCGPSTPDPVLMSSTSTTLITATTTTSKRSSPPSRLPCRVCTPGSTSGLPRTDTPDGSPDLSVATGLGGAGCGGRRIHLLVFQRARAVAARQEHQDVAGERPDPAIPDDCTGSAENFVTAPRFIVPRRSVAPSDRDWPLPAGQTAAG